MRILSILVFVFLITPKLYANILVIGDSHTAGPFGKYLHDKLTEYYPEKTIVTLGHSSSALIHWWSEKVYSLSGGVGHHMSANGKYYKNPNPTHWRVKREVPKLLPLLDNPILHDQWQQQLPGAIEVDTIVFALGANDRRAISRNDGTRTRAFEERKQIIIEALDEVERRGLKCIWIAPPHSVIRPLAVGDTTYQYIVEAVGQRCPIYDSRKFVARYCDQVHFNCTRALGTARTWAHEVADFIKVNL